MQNTNIVQKHGLQKPALLKKQLVLLAFSLLLALPALGQQTAKDVQDLPLIVTFDDYMGINLSEVTNGWSEAKNQPPEAGSGGWYHSNVLFGSNHAAIELNSNTHREWIISPRFYATENTQLSFTAAITYKHNDPAPGAFGGDDSLAIMISTDNGETFHSYYAFSSNSDQSLSSNMQRYTFNLSEYSGSNIRLGFFATDGSLEDGNCALHLDNIEIKNRRNRDVNVVALQAPAPRTCLGAEQPMIVQIKNEGYETLKNIPVRIKVRGNTIENLFGVISGPLPSDSIISKQIGTVDMQQPGTYNLQVQTEHPQDTYMPNDTLSRKRIHRPEHSLPLDKLTFAQSYGDLARDFEGWLEARGAGYPKVIKNTDWQSDDLNGEPGASLYFSGLYTKDWFISPRFQANSATKLAFDYAMNMEDGVNGMGSDDEMRIMVSSDCGQSWTEVDSICQNSAISSEWKLWTVDLSEFAGQTIQVAFYGTTGSNNDSQQYLFFVDNIEIREMYARDAGITGITAPAEPAAFSADETIEAQIYNYGTDTLYNVEVAYQINDNTPVTETVEAAIAPRSHYTYTFSQTADLTNQTGSTLKIYPKLENEENPENDALEKTLSTSSFNPNTQGTFTASFETTESLAGWFTVNQNNDEAEWERVEDPANAYKGNYSYFYNSKGTSQQSNDWLFSPALELTTGDTYKVSFYFNNTATNFPEKLRLLLMNAQSPDSVEQTLLDLGEIDNNEFLKAEISFTAPASRMYYLAWQAYGEPDQMGMHVDYVQVRKKFAHDIRVSDVLIPRQKDPETGALTNIDTIKVTVANPGQEPVDAFDVKLRYNQQQTLSQSYTQQNLQAGEQKQLVFDNGLNLDKDQIYDFSFWTEYEQDMNTANDTFRLNNFYIKHYRTSFEANEDLSRWATQDVAGDGYSWEIVEDNTKARTGNRCYQLPTNQYQITENDDWLFSEGFYLEADACYKVSFWYNAYYSEEKLVFLKGQAQNTSMQDTLTDFGIVGTGTGETWQYHKVNISVEETGVYYFGWHSDGSVQELSRYRLLLDDFELQQNFNFQPETDFSYKKLDREYYFESQATNTERYLWQFGDGAETTGPDAFHTYDTAGDYSVKFIGYNACAADTTTKTINHRFEVEAAFNYTIDSTTVNFTNTSAGAYGFLWHFGDDSTSLENEPTHNYPGNGDYTVKLKAIGQSTADTASQTLTIDTSSTGIGSRPEQTKVLLYPNPVKDKLHIRSNGKHQVSQVEVTAINGSIVMQKSGSASKALRLPFNAIPRGTYLVKVTLQNGITFVQKIIKK